MASPPKLISILLLITLLSMQVHGRESQFFSKVSNPNTQQKVPENEMTPNEKQPQEEQQEQKEPEFLPENQNTGYGLYGHGDGSGELPSTTDANLPYRPESEEFNSYPNTQNNNNYYDNRYSINGENQNEYGNSKFSQSGYQNQKAYFNGGQYNNYNVEKQGMSDTRFLENGKYFYDINSENNQNFNQYENTKNELPTSSNWNNNGGYYGQNNQNSYEYINSMGGYQNNGQNNQNSYEYRNSMGGYKNNEEPEKFQFQQNQFEP